MVNGGTHPSSLRILELSTCSDPSNRSTDWDLPNIFPAARIKLGESGKSREDLPNATASRRINSGVDRSSLSLTS